MDKIHLMDKRQTEALQIKITRNSERGLPRGGDHHSDNDLKIVVVVVTQMNQHR